MDFAKHGREKVPVQKFFLSQSIKSQALVLTFYAFALQMLFMRAAARIANTHRQHTFLTG
ncbi:MAG: hypothetical protein ACLTWR_06740 [Agathobaculum desmolans]